MATILTPEEQTKAEELDLGDFTFDSAERAGLQEELNEPLLISTEDAISDVQDATKTMERLSPAQTETGLTEEDVKSRVAAQQKLEQEEAAKKEKETFAGLDEYVKLTRTDPTTGQEQTQIFANPALNKSQIDALLSAGWNIDEANLKQAISFGPAQEVKPSLTPEQEALETAKSEVERLRSEADSFKITDAQLNSQIQNITSAWDSRVVQMQDVNKRREKLFETLGYRIGAQFTGGIRGGIFGGIIAEEERQGLMRIGELEAKKNAEIQDAKDAARKQNWDVYVTKLESAENTYAEQVKKIEEINKLNIAEQKKIDEQERKTTRDLAIAGLLNQGISDKKQLLNYLNIDDKGNIIGDFTAEEIDKTVDSLSGGAATKLNSDYELFNYAKDNGWLPENATLFDYWKLKAESQKVKQDPSSSGLDNKTITQIDKLSSGFDSSPITKQFNEVMNKKIAVESIMDTGIKGPADLALVFDFMKSLDPNSVVREAEYATAAKSGNIFQGIYSKFNGYMTEGGGFLPPNVRKEFVNIIDKKYKAVEAQYDNLRNETGRKINIKTGDVDGTDYITDYKGALDFVQDLQDKSENAELSLKTYREQNPDKLEEMDSRIQIMEEELDREITADEFLQAFPEYY